MWLDRIKKLAAERVSEPVNTQSLLEGFLRRWWATYYKRPFKDPLLAEYTLEELLLEYFEIMFTEYPEKLKAFMEGGGNEEEKKKQEDEEWLAKQIREAEIGPRPLLPKQEPKANLKPAEPEGQNIVFEEVE